MKTSTLKRLNGITAGLWLIAAIFQGMAGNPMLCLLNVGLVGLYAFIAFTSR